jgi:hypothetical protein
LGASDRLVSLGDRGHTAAMTPHTTKQHEGTKHMKENAVATTTIIGQDTLGKRCIVRTDRGGVYHATVKTFDPVTGTADITNSRRIWYWAGAASLSQLSQEGTKLPGECRFPVAVPEMTVLGVIEIIPTTAEADASIDAVPVWKA